MAGIKVSIIVPIYNVETYIIDCLKSIEAQIFSDYEVILVDDCGNDRSMLLVDEYLESSPLKVRTLILHHDYNRGLSAARNTGTEVARGKYVYYLDSDDTIISDCIKLMVDKAEEADAEMVVGGVRVVGNSDNIPTLECDNSLENDNIFHTYLNGGFYMMAWNKLARLDFLKEKGIEFVEGLIHEDCAWSFSVACELKKVAFVHECTYNYLVRNNSIQTDRDFKKHFDAYCQLIPYYVSEANKRCKFGDAIFCSWLERQKALFFAQTLSEGSWAQKMQIYGIIRKEMPQGRWTREDCHYLLPSFIGCFLYMKFYGYKLL